MKVTFIKPNMGLVNGRPYHDRGRMEPLTFAVLAGLLPDDCEFALFDDRYERIPYSEPTDLVCINVEIYTARRSYEIAARFRQRGVK
ncbi:MAG TPA: methylase, partial [Candidatus Rifleibacterium sp.]|nr:methylase [Candidatus Rifleibacterium sp.]